MADGPEPLAQRPEPDRLVRAVARSRIAEKLFATKEPVRIGRYHLLEVVGEGGMGVVWGAWDPDLERRVAIKLLVASHESSRERILAEGQALAKLSHPNVVPVFDVGVIDERVYLVMEWVRGKNLRAWAGEKPRTVREVVAAYRAAGEGLGAAHEAKIIHRDFKPENAVIGDDGRVRVLDFGLARSERGEADGSDDGTTRGAGTPRYMPPEQREGRELTGAADQFAFGASLREAVAAQGAVPGWITAITDRATAVSPGDRFPSMAELLAALARDPRVVWRRRILAGTAVAVAGGAFAAGSLRGGDVAERCTGAPAEIASAWSSTQRDALVAKLRRLGGYGEGVAAQIASELDAYAGRWVTARRGACLAADAGELPPARYDLDVGCLARARAGLGAAHDVLARADLTRLPDALVAARSLPDPQRCRLEAETSTVAPPSALLAPRVTELANDVARARVLARALDPSAVELAATTAKAATDLGYGPLIARATLAHGTALSWKRLHAPAIEAFERAHGVAFATGDHAIAIEAIARELYAAAMSGEAPPTVATPTIASAQIAENIARGLGPSGAFERALLLNNLGALRLSEGDRPGARAYFAAALRERPTVTGETYELASIPSNLALVEEDPAMRTRLFAQEEAELTSVVGADHPFVLESRAKAAAFLPDAASARRALRDTRQRVERLHPHLVNDFGSLGYDLMFLAWDAADAPAVHEASRWVSNELDRRLARGLLLLLEDKPAEALADAHAHADELLAADRLWWRWRAIDALLVAALAEQRLGRTTAARATVARALDTAEKASSFANTIFYKRRLARLEALRAELQ